MPGGPNSPNMAAWQELVRRVKDEEPTSDAGIVIILLTAVADTIDELRKHATVAAALAVSGNTESAFTNYVRTVLGAADIEYAVVDVDGIPPSVTWTIADQTPLIANGGNGTNEMVVAALVAHADAASTDPDSALRIIGSNIFSSPITTEGVNINADFPDPLVFVQFPDEALL